MEFRTLFHLTEDPGNEYFRSSSFRDINFVADTCLLALVVVADAAPILRYGRLLPVGTIAWCLGMVGVVAAFWSRAVWEAGRVRRIDLPGPQGADSNGRELKVMMGSNAGLVHFAVVSIAFAGLALSEQAFALGHLLRR